LANDHYAVLGVKRNATTVEIRAAYQKLILENHPDANSGDPNAAEKTKAINKAYQTLRSEESRKEYDLTLDGAKPGQAKRGPAQPSSGPSAPATSGRPAATTFGGGIGGGFGGLIDGMHAESARNGRAGSTVRVDQEAKVPTIEIHLTTREALQGTTKTIKVNGRLLNIRLVVDR
jgi:DnaJ-class molecular chaperone